MNNLTVRIADKSDYKSLIYFRKKLYDNNIYYRDNETRMLKALLFEKTQIQKQSQIIPVLVEKNNIIIGFAMIAFIDRMSDYVQISFLEMRNDIDIFSAIVEFTKKLAKTKNIHKIIVGMNLHVNYGLGMLANNFNKNRSIGSTYNHSYYIDIIEPFATRTKLLKSYSNKISELEFDNISSFMQERLNKFEIRFANFKNIEQTAKIYSNINNLAFKNHSYYYESRDEENIELFNDFKYLLKPENLMFAFYKDKPVAFILWYPDFNQLIKPQKELGISSVIKSRLFPKTIDTIKFTEFGVIPKFQRTGVIYSLLKKCYELNKDKYKYIESGWILSDNAASTNLVKRFLKEEGNLYKVFEIDF